MDGEGVTGMGWQGWGWGGIDGNVDVGIWGDMGSQGHGDTGTQGDAGGRRDTRAPPHLSVRLSGRRHGTESRMQVPVAGSVPSTMTNGRSSKVATVRWRPSSAGCRERP